MITLGLIQASSVPDADANLRTIRKFAGDAKKRDCAALCFPEAFLTGYVPKEAGKLAVAADDASVNQLSELAKEVQMDLLIGMMERQGNQYFLTHAVLRADGIRMFYRKTHLGEREQMVFSAGERLEIFSLSCGLKAGIQLCIETHFPEITQTLSLRGAEVVFAPHAIPRAAGSRKDIWSKFIPARSYDNRVYMACCNQWDEAKFGGGCMVTDPKGDMIASCFEDQEDVLYFQVEPEAVRAYHREDSRMKGRYYPAKRRAGLYDA